MNNQHYWSCYTDGVLYGPMHSQQGVEMYKNAVADAVAQGGKIECGGKVRYICHFLVTAESSLPVVNRILC